MSFFPFLDASNTAFHTWENKSDIGYPLDPSHSPSHRSAYIQRNAVSSHPEGLSPPFFCYGDLPVSYINQNNTSASLLLFEIPYRTIDSASYIHPLLSPKKRTVSHMSCFPSVASISSNLFFFIE